MNSTTKWKRHYDLDRVKDLIRSGKIKVTVKAADTADELGFETEQAIADFLLTLKTGEFFKSITSDNNHKEWQDVYHPMIGKIRGYIKFKVVNDVVVLSFKEKTEW